MNYVFKIKIYTDGDFSLPYVPRGMTYNDCYQYKFKKSYRNIDKAIEDVLEICSYLKDNMHTSRDYVKEYWDRCIDDFVEQLNAFDKNKHEKIYSYMSGNYDGTKFSFYSKDDYVKCNFYASDEELKMIKENRNGVTNAMIKEAVMNLFREGEV